MITDTLQMWVVYDHPSDFPNSVVVRRWQITDEGQRIADPVPCVICQSVDEARQLMPQGLTLLARDPDDDPAIVETWI